MTYIASKTKKTGATQVRSNEKNEPVCTSVHFEHKMSLGSKRILENKGAQNVDNCSNFKVGKPSA